MKNFILHASIISVIFLFNITSFNAYAQDTFSIVAVDTVTGEIGSAGASCVGPFGGVGAFILSDVIEGIGAIHTQAYYNENNQDYAHDLMLMGLSPQEMIDSLRNNDAQNNPTIRQYGIVSLTMNGESAAFTGQNCDDYKNHVTGPGYAVQGNILMGQVIIDTMQHAFLNTEGPLADRLMKTLEAAKIIGADTRCEVRGTSSRSSFIKVVRLGDNGDFYLKEIVPDSDIGEDPIDVLKDQFDQWKLDHLDVVDPFLSELVSEYDTLNANGTSTAVITILPKNNSDTLLAPGLEILLSNTGEGTIGTVIDQGNGIYEAEITSPENPGTDTIFAKTVSGNDTVEVFQKLVIYYRQATSIDNETNKPGGFRLYQNYPDPFNPQTTIKFSLGKSGFVNLTVYDILGNKVTELVNEFKTAGEHSVVFNTNLEKGKLTSGIYFYQITSGNFSDIKKMVLLR